MKLLRNVTSLALVLAVLTAANAGAAVKKSTLKLGPNLVVNPSFEDGTAYVPPLPGSADGTPLGPIGWTFEGATILFDYNQHIGHTGKRNVAISGSLAPGKQACDASSGSYKCVPNPAAGVTGAVNDAALSRSSIRPFWVTAKAIPVTPGKAYRFAMWSIRPSLDPNAGVLGEGAATKVRWVNASGATVQVVDGPAAVKTAKRELGFRQAFLDLTAPAGAVGAVLLLGHTDYTVTSAQVAFDDILFAAVLHR